MTTPPLRDAIAAAARKLDLPGAINGLVQTVLRLTVPGVPDLYQGAEFWDYSLVDPDNRRPVDHAERKAALDEALTPTDALLTWRDGRIKQAIIGKLLALRHRYPMLFIHGDYYPLSVSGIHADHIVAFTRRYAGYQLLVVVPRLATELLGEAEQPHILPQRWEDTHLLPEAGLWQSVLTESSLEISKQGVPIATLLAELPVGVFLLDDGTDSSDWITSPLHQYRDTSK
jgi:(1->4)-alpha-D-glucan 1-alpha-D-glucosylmutase